MRFGAQGSRVWVGRDSRLRAQYSSCLEKDAAQSHGGALDSSSLQRG